MTTPTNPIEPFSPFLPATVSIPEEEDRRRTFLVDHFSAISDVVNDKKIGAYTQDSEEQNGNKFSYDTTSKVRSGSQSVCRIPSFIPQTITFETSPKFPISDINPQFVVSHVWGSASKPCSAVSAGDGDYFSFCAQGDSRIQFTMSDTTITITTDGGRSAYSGFIFIEYIRDGV